MPSFNRTSVVVVHPSGAFSRMPSRQAEHLLLAGQASKTGPHRIALLTDRGGQLEYGYEWKGQQSGYAGPQVMQRVPMMKSNECGRAEQDRNESIDFDE